MQFICHVHCYMKPRVKHFIFNILLSTITYKSRWRKCHLIFSQQKWNINDKNVFALEFSYIEKIMEIVASFPKHVKVFLFQTEAIEHRIWDSKSSRNSWMFHVYKRWQITGGKQHLSGTVAADIDHILTAQLCNDLQEYKKPHGAGSWGKVRSQSRC